MNEEHLSSIQLGRYRRRVMAPAELLAADTHLSGCLVCRKAAEREVAGTVGVESLHAGVCGLKSDPEAHLTYEQLASLVDGTLAEVERENLESHLAVCGECKADWMDLDNLRQTMVPMPSRRPAETTVDPWWRRTAALFGRQAWWTPLSAAAAFAAVALLIWVGSLPLRRQSTVQREEAVQSGRQAPTKAVGEDAKPADNVIVQLNDGGGQVTLSADGSLEGLPGASHEQRDAVREVLRSGRLALPDSLAEYAGRPETQLGSEQHRELFDLISPVGTAVIVEKPTFRWNPMPGARRYKVSIFDSSYAQVVTSSPITSTEWAQPEALEAGRVYSWQVRAITDSGEVLSPRPPSPEAKFKVLDRIQATELQRAQRGQADSHLVLAILYAAAGALDDAERELKALAEVNPRSPVPQGLRRELSSARHR